MSIQKNEKIFLPVVKIFYAEVGNIDPDISSIEENADGTVNITFQSGRDWKEFYATTGSIEFSENESEKDEGILFSQSLKVNFPGDGNENRQNLELLRNKPLVLKLQFTEGYEKMMGTLENPAFITKKNKSANYVSAYEISFKRYAEKPLPYIA